MDIDLLKGFPFYHFAQLQSSLLLHYIISPSSWWCRALFCHVRLVIFSITSLTRLLQRGPLGSHKFLCTTCSFVMVVNVRVAARICHFDDIYKFSRNISSQSEDISYGYSCRYWSWPRYTFQFVLYMIIAYTTMFLVSIKFVIIIVLKFVFTW